VRNFAAIFDRSRIWSALVSKRNNIYEMWNMNPNRKRRWLNYSCTI